ncbi:MAG TPA: GNAT family N-acetyltransferase [Hyphomicrobium sp.]|nr:GNAT family N-acetyltransferase [Hyphomicrobium sp.]
MRIVRYSELVAHPAAAPPGGAPLAAALDRIFFEASNTKDFASDGERAAFRERWLGRYLRRDPEIAFVALDAENAVAGYIVGALEDPAMSARFSDIWYFTHFQELTRRYPAHLHVNLGPAFRNRGVGSALVSRFLAEARGLGAPGAHVVTGEGARNIVFYARNGFHEAGLAARGCARVVFLARDLTDG